MDPTFTHLSHQRSLSLSLGGYQKKKKKKSEKKVKGKIKQKMMSNKKNRWIQNLSIKNEYIK